MDITTKAVAATSTIHLKDAAGELMYDGDKPVQIVVYGPGSKEFGVVESRQSSRAVKRMSENDNKVSVAPFETRVAETAEDLAAVTVRFDNITYPPAGDAQGTALFEAVYRDQSLGFIVKQVSKHLADWANFKPASGVS